MILCGNQQVILKELEALDSLSHPRLIIRHCSEVVTNACEPASAVRSKKDSSMRVALDLVKSGEAQACVSSGNTGALFFMAHYVLKMLPGVKRPALISAVPTERKRSRLSIRFRGQCALRCANTLSVWHYGLCGRRTSAWL